ncbi:tubulointerstitial nephritis antigen-like [Aplysia californica]|uniref:Tubulointerstitial nephritis antigen-like n=1 Tax=Aplysia californica TaxID=6500 RepID=A0ABM1A472_APLCA|nr:tubulointerstitial nephritis antigen-like [Aplysia californica]
MALITLDRSISSRSFSSPLSSNLRAFIVIVQITILLTCLPLASGFFGEWGPDLEGPWCAKRPLDSQCCDGRDDYCGVPILGTECYCDIFCNETAYDCCPDYWQHCHGHFRPTTTPRPTTLPTPRPVREPCIKDGVRYGPGEKTSENCNDCTCELIDPVSGRYDWRCSNDPCLLRPELIQAVNDGDFTWKASNYSKLWGLTLDEGVRYRLGTFLLEADVLRMTPISVIDDVLPESFDARQKWPNLLSPVRDQGNCASSWAHSTTAVAEDRLRIETAGVMTDSLSVQHLLSCDRGEQMGCEGGRLDRAWWFMRKFGVVTEECYPYTSGLTDSAGQCLVSPKQKSGACPSGIMYKRKRYKATPPYRIRPVEREIMKEIMDNGPVQATLLVREDFFMYRRGIYSYSDLTSRRGDPETYLKSGFHSVRIIGWGAERTERGDIIKYWLCANSWGPEWGESGYFRILRGSDESRIERYVVGVWGKVSGDDVLRLLLKESRRRRLRTRRSRRQLRHIRTRGSRRRDRRRRMRALKEAFLATRPNDSRGHRQSSTSSRRRRERGHGSKKHKKNKNKKTQHRNQQNFYPSQPMVM